MGEIKGEIPALSRPSFRGCSSRGDACVALFVSAEIGTSAEEGEAGLAPTPRRVKTEQDMPERLRDPVSAFRFRVLTPFPRFRAADGRSGAPPQYILARGNGF